MQRHYKYAMRMLPEREALFNAQMSSLAEIIGGQGKKGGKRWRLVFTAGRYCSHIRRITACLLHHSTAGNVSGKQSPYLDCSSTEGSRWVHAGKDAVNKATKGEKAGGLYFPIPAVQVGAVIRFGALNMYP